MSSVISYPAKISDYSITISPQGARIRLSGHSKPKGDNDFGDGAPKNIAHVAFMAPKDGETDLHKPFINRGGFLEVTHHLNLLPSVLVLLNQWKDLYLTEDGGFTTNGNVG